MGFDRIGPGLSRLSTAVSPGGGGGIKSVQSGRITANGVHTLAIQPVRPDQSMLLWKPALSTDARNCSYAQISGPTSLAIDGVASSHLGADYTVVEFAGAIRSIQRGVAIRTSSASGAFDITISPVDLSKAIINLTGSSAGDATSNNVGGLVNKAEFLSSTAVRFLSGTTIIPNYVAYEIVEFA